jgi:hypothetical protein
MPLAESQLPSTFVERGVAVPFTTPRLGGTRARRAENRRLELSVPNLSGGRGVYIIPWSGLAELCRPTLHDKVFSQRISGIINLTPTAVRQVARQIATEGLAGDEAMEAARAASDTDKGDRVIANHRLMVTLVEQVVDWFSPPALTCDEAQVMEPAERARLAVDCISPRLGQTTTWTGNALEELADAMAATGVGSVGATGRTPRLINLLRDVRASVSDWSGTQRQENMKAYARMLCTVADLTLTLTQTVVAEAQALPDNMIELLRSWAADRDAVIGRVQRPDWLLDGWEQICLIWNAARDDAERYAALAEIAARVPILPKEANEWCSTSYEIDNLAQLRRVTGQTDDWSPGSMEFNLIARNEHFRAMSA